MLPSDPHDPIRYEHDLATYKPRADVVILGTPAPPQPGPVGGGWDERVLIGGTTMTATFNNARTLTHFNGVAVAVDNVPWANTMPITVGWQNRVVDGGDSDTREDYAGMDLEAFDAETMELPQNFNNLFFNGVLYSSTQPTFAHISASVITIETRGEYDDGAGGTETITNTTLLRLPAAPQMTVTFRTGDAPAAPMSSANVSMNLDTVVYDKATAQFYAVWRGVWTDFETVGIERMVSVALS